MSKAIPIILGLLALPAASTPVSISNSSFETNRNHDQSAALTGGAFARGESRDFGANGETNAVESGDESRITGWTTIATENVAAAGTQVAVGFKDLTPNHPSNVGEPPFPQALSLMAGAAIHQETPLAWSALSAGEVLRLTVAVGDRSTSTTWADQSFVGLTDGSPSGTIASGSMRASTVANSGELSAPPSGIDSGTMADVIVTHTVTQTDVTRSGNVGIVLAGHGSTSAGDGLGSNANQAFFDDVRLERITPATPPPQFPVSITPAPGGFHLSWPSQPGSTYRVRSSPDLSQPPSTWQEEVGGLVATPPLNTEPVEPQGDKRFYVVEESPADPLNVLLVIGDDWRHDTLGCAGHPIVQTPSLDRLADEGVRFTQAAVTSSVCWVSRASIFMGQWMSRHGRTTSGASITNWSASFPSLLRSSGYWVGHVGKWHNGTFPSTDHDFSRIYSGTHWYSVGGQQVHVTQRNENDALEFLRNRPANKPFLLTVATFAPHAEDSNSLQYLPQPETTSLYTNVNVPVPINATDASFQRLPSFLATEQNEGRVRWNWRFDTPEKYQSMMKNYFRLCTGVDTMCGRILAELEQQGVLEQTLVIFIGDNGYFHAEHGLADKWYPFQESIRVPLIVRDPRLPAAVRGQTHEAFALNVDLAPTILSAAGLAVPASMQGRDLTPLYLATLPPDWREEFFYEHPTITNINRIPSSQALVRRDWKYFYWPNFSREQLFGLEADPIEENDLSGDPAQIPRLLEMRSRFNELKTSAQ